LLLCARVMLILINRWIGSWSSEISF